MQEAPKATIYPKRGRFSNQRKAAEASFTLQTKKLLRTSFPSFCSDRRHPSPAHISARAPPPRRPPLLPSAPAAAPPLHAGGAQLLPSVQPDGAPPLRAARRRRRRLSPSHRPPQLLPSAPAAAPPLHAGGAQLLPWALDTAAAWDRGRPPLGGSGRGELPRARGRGSTAAGVSSPVRAFGARLGRGRAPWTARPELQLP